MAFKLIYNLIVDCRTMGTVSIRMQKKKILLRQGQNKNVNLWTNIQPIGIQYI